MTNLCAERQLIGVSLPGGRRQGAFAEYCAVPARILHRFPEALDYDRACLMEPLSIVVHALGRCPLAPGDTAVVIGGGFVGLLAVQLLRRAGLDRIVVVDRNGWKLAVAQRTGASHTAPADSATLRALVDELTGGRGADLAVDAAGNEQSLRLAFTAVRSGGAIGQVGNFAPEVTLPLQTLVSSELTIYGSATALRAEESRSLAMLAQGAVEPAPLVSAVAPLAEGSSWFARLRNREDKLLKVILRPSS
jgi:L-iditol 2-dehydrogenase